MSLSEKESVLPTSFLIEGPINHNQFSLIVTNQRIHYPPEAIEFIENAWQDRAAQNPGRVQRDSPAIILLNITREMGGYQLIAGLTSYKYRYGTTLPQFVQHFGTDLVAKTIGADALILTGDDKLIVGQRNTHRAGKTGGLHLPGGLIEQERDLVTAVKREIREEVGIEADEWEIESILGVQQSRETLSSGIVYFGITQLSSTEIVKKNTDNELGRKFIPNDPDIVRKLLLQFSRTASTSVIGALYLYGKQNFGLDWADQVLDRVSRRSFVYEQFNLQAREIHMKKLAAKLATI
jgi:8-oxo-dGTP pyrophosphatase MutT (NUDIX family)